MTLTNATTGVRWDPSVGSAPGWPLVLYFHRVNPKLRHYTNVTQRQFADAIELLSNRFELVDPQQLLPIESAGCSGTPRVVITFDDGHADVYQHALPVLRAFAIRAAFFVATNWISDDARDGRMTWSMLSALRGEGHVVANHTHSHVRMDRLSRSEVTEEVELARDLLERRLGSCPRWLALPYGLPPRAGNELLDWLCFGTVKSVARPWHTGVTIRRTYLPARRPDQWRRYVDTWSDQCASRC